MVTACIVGDVVNAQRNYVAAINTEGWLFVFDVPRTSNPSVSRNVSPDQAQEPHSQRQYEPRGHVDIDDGQTNAPVRNNWAPIKLSVSYDQRMPANCKDLLLADLDGDGQNELIVGLTDRVLRTYKWITIGPDRGKFVGLYKWEFADQIGAVSLNPSQHENCQDIIVAQPGGTYAKLECFDKKPTTAANPNSTPSDSLVARLKQVSIDDDASEQQQQPADVPDDDDDNVRTEYISKLTPEYHQLALAQMRNHHISTEVLGGIRDKKSPDTHHSSSLIVIATLDGTLMLVNKDEILWSIQVDHQLFALAMLESSETSEMSDADNGGPKLSQSESTCTIVPSSKFDNYQQQQQSSISAGSVQASDDDTTTQQADGDGSKPSSADGSDGGNKQRKVSQYFAVCAWNGKTYIVDEERNYLRFKFDEAVSAFTAGNYYFEGAHHSALVYATFNNQIVLYYDILRNQIRPMYLLNEILNNPRHNDLLKKLEILNGRVLGTQDTSIQQLRDLLHDVLYAVTNQELGVSARP